MSTPYMSTAGVPDDMQWNGVYAASIAVTQDPLNQGRVRLFIPQVLGTAQSNWASAMQPGITPAAGTQVLAIFLGGNINLPYYFVGISTSLIEAVSSGSTVLNSNPFFTGNLLTGWSGVGGTLLALQPNADTNPPFPNAAFLSLSGTGGGYIQEDAAVFTAVVGNYYQIQAWVYYPLGGGVNIGAWFPSAGDLVTEMSVEPGVWTNISVTVQATDTSGYPLVGPIESSPGDQFYATAICVIGQPNAADIGGIINGYNAFGTVIGGSAFLLYNGIPQNGNLIGSWSPSAGGVDLFGNSYPIGFNAVQGDITGMGVTNAQVLSSTLQNCSSIAETISNPNITGGLMVETTITFDSFAGVLYAYATTTTTISQNTNGNYQWTCPAGTSTASVQCWGAGAGGSGNGEDSGQDTGGPGGGGGEFAAEYQYAVTPGNVYNYQVGNGGGGGTANAGQDGGDTSFDNGGVFANGGTALAASWTGGLGGTGSTNSAHFDGGAGGTPTPGKTGGSSGGNSGGGTGAGNSGSASTGSSGAPAPAAQSPNGHGATGGNAAANGGNGGTPGAGGGGAGFQTGSQAFSQTFNCTSSRSYYGSNATNGNPNGTRATNSTCWQGGELATGGSANGTQKSVFLFSASAIASALVGVTVSEVDFTITNAHSWYNSGMTVVFNEWKKSQGSSLPSSWNGSGSPSLTQSTCSEGQRKTYQFFNNTVAPADFQSGAAIGITLGPPVGADYNVNFYGYFDGTGSGGNAVQLTIKGTTGSAPTSGGSGADGQVYITYTSGSSIVCAISPTGGTDQYGNTVAAGYTGPTTAFNPSTSNPSLVEIWHTVGNGTNGAGSTLGSGFSFTGNAGQPLQFMLASDGNVYLNGAINCSSGTATGSIVICTLPSAWRPNRTCFFPWAYFPYSATNAANDGFGTIGTNGQITIGYPTGSTITATVFATYYPLVSNVA